MMWLVELALRRRYTFIVMAALMMILGFVTIEQTPTDIFPNINIPVVSMIWSYTGISANDMARRITVISERAATTTVSNIEHIESTSFQGVSVIKFYFQPGTNGEAGVAQLTSIAQTILRALPPGTTPPLIIQYSASSVPILQLGISSNTLSESQLYDEATNFIRTQLATVQGASVPLPYGGKQREIIVDLDIQALQSKGLTPVDVSAAVGNQNLILPTGTEKIGKTEYNIFLNNSPNVAADIGNMPIKQVNGATVYIRDVASVHDGFGVQQNIVDINGRRAVLLTVLKNGDASTLSVVQRVLQRLPQIQRTLPKDLKITPMFDQSIFVREAISGVIREAAIAACLTAAMILVFLGSWKSTLIVAVSIPLAILTSIICLGALGETMNEMTLGGLALAVGILVDDATVEIENIHRNMGLETRGIKQVILDGAAQIAAPTFVATISICIVFVSVVFLTGPAKYLFTPLALAVVFAMLASYLLSRTLVPVMALLMLKDEIVMYQEGGEKPKGDIFWRVHQAFEKRFDKFRDWYGGLLKQALQNRKLTIIVFCLFFLISGCLFPFLGQDFFPTVDAGQLQLHVRAPAGTRIEETANYFNRVEEMIRKIVPAKEMGSTIDDIGLPLGGVNLAFSNSATVGAGDGQILLSLADSHRPVSYYEQAIRKRFRQDFPDGTLFFQPADMESQILNFGLPAPIDIQVVGNSPKNYDIARQIANQIKVLPGAVDVYVQQIVNYPSYLVSVDRDKAIQFNLTENNVANSLLLSLSGSGQVAPSYWLDPKNGVSYLVAVQTPQYKMDSVRALFDTPVNATGTPPQLLDNVATFGRTNTPQVISHYNVQPTFDIYANVANRDLGGLTSDVESVLTKYKGKLPQGTTTALQGQTLSMKQSFSSLKLGILFAIILVYLLMVVNFQTLIDPLIIIGALPGAMSGVLWMLFLTSTTVNVPSLMGSIMCIGVATANSILVVTFANDRRLEGDDSIEAAYQAGLIRIRPVLMTALAMTIGMLPMALGLGEGGEQNAPLGRAVLGGLIVATVTTLFFVPVLYSIARRRQPEPDEDSPHAQPGAPADQRHGGSDGQEQPAT
jgi:multidrug efflux pump subunit AcrB